MSRLSPHGGGNKFNQMMREVVLESGRDMKARVVSRGVVVPSNVGRFKYRFNGRTTACRSLHLQVGFGKGAV